MLVIQENEKKKKQYFWKVTMKKRRMERTRIEKEWNEKNEEEGVNQ